LAKFKNAPIMVLNDKKVINGWAMYDWANSVYSLVITSTIFPIYYASITTASNGDKFLNFMGYRIANTVLYSWSISFSFLLLAILLPVLSGIADYSGSKKNFMRFFAYLGSISCAALFFFKTREDTFYGLLCSVMASIGFGGSLVFYNAYLPEITTPENYDRVSAKGYAMGYIGSVLLMIVNLMMVQHKEWFGFSSDTHRYFGDPTLPSRVVFVTVGLWWFGFSQVTFARLPKSIAKPSDGNIIAKGFKELVKVWNSLKTLPKTRNFLIAFFFYDMGVQTIMYLAATYGSDHLELSSSVLITTILLIQVVAIGGAYLFAWVSKIRGNIFSLSFMIVLWIFVCAGIFFVNKNDNHVAYEFEGVAVLVGLVMGGIQSLSRATYSKLLPETEDHASYFSFYDVCEKICIVLGTLLFGLMQQTTGDMRNSVWPLLVAFVIGLIVLQTTKSKKLEGEKL
jgi:MFS transporter, UMF1 family